MASLEDLQGLKKQRCTQVYLLVAKFLLLIRQHHSLLSQLNRIPAFDRTYIFQSHHLPLQQPERSQQQRPGPSWTGFGWTWR